ncbi:hypothetical protein OZ664_13935 [Elizabethkingia sp. HX WHF]|uniref:LA_2272 family surface repeat-containing protein n=1 Tax=Elizabethkingia TaxID=308865 RepID=UPI00099AB51C|nr:MULTISPECIES: hypothetical protein [Elizabethkingia]ATL43896.1 hypothetical protein CQS02_11580 [Elizabethkingia miricola]MCL1637647.1 hypothetical protein [Elizabethkingia bruuniana]MDX8565105.1 hypothetical protein [Elizabethkingia sp. HX WHF]OPC18054.1 hypothetical protein BAY00_15725 [Elizabethkingia bruuniana]OPC58373.1 hypothetical protein BAY07_04625 [Elizabethkingia bruuniana]
MKTKLFLLLLFYASMVFGQSKDSTRIIAITPLSKKIQKVNGLAIGVGMDDVFSPISKKKTVNGLNIDANPLGIIIWMFYDPSKVNNSNDILQYNGLNISAAGFLRDHSHNGLNISLYNYGNKMNGVSLAGLWNVVEEENGLFIGGLGNYAERGSGVIISASNGVKEFKGVQIGLINNSDNMKGLQIGLYNKNKSGKNFQIGLWNRNERRSFPIINWNFKKTQS